jgi:hypothetical protein
MLHLSDGSYDALARQHRALAEQRFADTMRASHTIEIAAVCQMRGESEANLLSQLFDAACRADAETVEEALDYSRLVLHPRFETFDGPSGAWLAAALSAPGQPLADRLASVADLLDPPVHMRIFDAV